MKSNYIINSPRVIYRGGYLNLTPELFRHSDNVFIENHGFKVIDGPCGWLKIENHVFEHCDEDGRCFVYCSSGVCVLNVDGFRSVILKRGSYFVFNDQYTHSLNLVTKSVNILIANVKKINKKV